MQTLLTEFEKELKFVTVKGMTDYSVVVPALQYTYAKSDEKALFNVVSKIAKVAQTDPKFNRNWYYTDGSFRKLVSPRNVGAIVNYLKKNERLWSVK